MLKFLEKNGIIGLDHLEKLILTAALSADSVMLVGTRGSVKTTLTKVVAQILYPTATSDKSKFIAYSVPNNEFEHFIGFPHPGKMMEGTIDFVKGPMSIWDKPMVLLGEFNRVPPSMQGNYLQLMLSREVLGLRTANEIVWADMNPLSYEGTHPLDPAAADRFSIILKLPDFHEFNVGDKAAIATHIGFDSMHVLKKHSPDLFTTLTDNPALRECQEQFILLKKIAFDKLYLHTLDTYQSMYAKYVAMVVQEMKATYLKGKFSVEEQEKLLHNLWSGRKASMLTRSLLFRTIVELALNNYYYNDTFNLEPLTGNIVDLQQDEIENIIKEVVNHSDSLQLIGGEHNFDNATYMLVHEKIMPSLSLSKKQVVNWESIFNNAASTSPIEALAIGIGHFLNEENPSLMEFIPEKFLINQNSSEKVSARTGTISTTFRNPNKRNENLNDALVHVHHYFKEFVEKAYIGVTLLPLVTHSSWASATFATIINPIMPIINVCTEGQFPDIHLDDDLNAKVLNRYNNFLAKHKEPTMGNLILTHGYYALLKCYLTLRWYSNDTEVDTNIQYTESNINKIFDEYENYCNILLEEVQTYLNPQINAYITGIPASREDSILISKYTNI